MSEYWTEKDVMENAILDLQHERDDLQADLARRDDLIKRLVEDGERLADNYIAAKRMICACFGADYQDDEIITLHRALMKELGHEGEK